VKAFDRRRDGEPGGGEAQEGIESAQRLIAEAQATDSRVEQSPEVETTVRGGGGNIVSESAPTARGHESDGESRRGCLRGKTPEEQTLDVAVG
jgi:hypothetical protein